MKKSILILYIFLLTGLSACNDDQEPVIDPPEEISENMKLLTDGEWIRTASIRNGLDVWTIFPPCSKDDIYIYNIDGSAYVDQAEDVCDSTYPQKTYWDWEFSDNETQFTETMNDSLVLTRHILELTLSDLKIATYYNGEDTLLQYFRKIPR